MTLMTSLSAQQRFFGVNLAGADFGTDQDGTGLPGVFNTSYIYPNQAEVDYFKSKKMNIVRLPFRWERLQPTLNMPFDSSELSRLTTFVNATTAKDVTVLLDPHNYARYNGNLIGSNAVPVSAFNDFWTRLSNTFKSNPKVIFGLMNEPSRMSTNQWRSAANSAIQAIRNTSATNLILIPGNGWTGGHSWLQNWYAAESPNSNTIGPNGYKIGSNAEEMLNIVDPQNNFAFDIHQYLDFDFSGEHPECVSATIGSEKLAEITTWLTTHNRKAFLGEFGGGTSSTCLAAISNISKYIVDRPNQWIGWCYWAAGPWWGDYFTSLEPTNIGTASQADRPQMAALSFPNITTIFAPTSVQYLANSNQLLFKSESAFKYQVQSNDNLTGNWVNFGSAVPGTGNSMQLSTPPRISTETKKFYRLAVSSN